MAVVVMSRRVEVAEIVNDLVAAVYRRVCVKRILKICQHMANSKDVRGTLQCIVLADIVEMN